MKVFPTSITFKYDWRAYQQRILDNLTEHLDNDHLHVVAPPGSGKTVLGWEVAIRINKPTLILAPTIAIRNQWIQRFCDLFLQEKQIPDWISTDIRKPSFITVATYQGLHAACTETKEKVHDQEKEDDGAKKINQTALKRITDRLKKQRVGTLVLDEAHHLKNAWWQTLFRIKEQLKPIVVGLTATPPYDVSAAEWKRYMEMNGPIDEEIAVPELIKANDLCLHQDYVHFMLPTQAEVQRVQAFREKAANLFTSLKQDETLIQAMEGHPYWSDPTEHLDSIYNNLSFYSACLIFLAAAGKVIPDFHKDIIGDQDLGIPLLDYVWMQRLLQFYLAKEQRYFEAFDKHRTALENRLRRHGIYENKRIDFLNNKTITHNLGTSIQKLDGIRDIVDFEYTRLERKLRLVVLADYIRKEFFPNSTSNELELTRLGVFPIFEKLRRENRNKKKIAVLTGSFIIIPTSAKMSLQQKAAELGLSDIGFSIVPFDSDYLSVNLQESLKHQLVHLVTQIFQEGEVEVLIGTKALLGEGWDAPAINALILASFVGSFVLSNQMRGRAIRTEKGNANKTSNIWHLACLDPTLPSAGADFDLLKRKFKAFIGISFQQEGGIENGINRLNLPVDINSKDGIATSNETMFRLAADREGLKQRWEQALQQGVSMVEEIKIPFHERKTYAETKSFYLTKTIANLSAALAASASVYVENILSNLNRIAKNIRNLRELYITLLAIATGAVVLFGRQAYITFRLYIRYRDISKDVQRIGEALLATLQHIKVIQSDLSAFDVEARIDEYGAIYCHLNGGTTFEKSTFIQSMQEIVEPIDSPRYLIVRKHWFMKWSKQIDYHAVPEIIGRNKESAQFFEAQWKKAVGATDLIFTRNTEGRKMLLQARFRSLSAQFQDNIEHVSKWL